MSLCVKTPLCPHTALWCWATANACVCSCRYTAASVIDTTSKYKFLWKLPLEEVEVVKSKTQKQNLVVVFFSNFFFFYWFCCTFYTLRISAFVHRFHSGNKQGEHPEDDQPTRGGSQHNGSDQQTVRDPQLPTPGTGYIQSACPAVSLLVLSCYICECLTLFHGICQSLDEVIKDLMASVHKELSEKQSLAFSMTFLPTKLEFTTVSAESTFVFEFSSPDALSSFEQAFEDAKKKLGEWGRRLRLKWMKSSTFFCLDQGCTAKRDRFCDEKICEG